MTETTQAGCQCGCGVVTDVTNAGEACGCGCDCCSGKSKSTEQELTELRTLRDRIDQRLAEIERS